MKKYVDYITEVTCQLLAIDSPTGYTKNAAEFVMEEYKKLGVEATPKALNDLKLQKQHEAKVAQEQYEAAVEPGKVVETQKVVVKVKCGDGGRLFGTVSTKEIAAAFKEQCNVTIDKKKIQLDEAIKNFGVYKVNISVHSFENGTKEEIDKYSDDDIEKNWNTITEWGTLALLPIFQILGTNYKSRNIITKTVDKNQ